VRHVRMLGLCLVAALAVCAYAVSSASALPEWGECVEVAPETGLYSGPNCTKLEKAKPKGTGNYEWKKGTELAPREFTGESGAATLYSHWWFCSTDSHRKTREACESEGGKIDKEGFIPTIECTGQTNVGTAEGKNAVSHVHVIFEGCVALEVIPCQNTPNAGEVQVGPLKGKLGWIEKHVSVGVSLTPEAHHGTFAVFSCGGELTIAVGVGNKKEGAFYVKGEKYKEGCAGPCPGATPGEEKKGGYDEIISPIEPVNEMTTTYTQKYTVNLAANNGVPGEEAHIENVPRNLAGKHISLLESWTEYIVNSNSVLWGDAAEELTTVQTTSPAGEIKAG
jgi:hypothetical protein